MLSTGNLLQISNDCQAGSKRLGKDMSYIHLKKERRVAVLIFDMVDFRTKKVTRKRKGQNIIIKCLGYQEDTTILNSASKQLMQKQKTKGKQTIPQYSWRFQHCSSKTDGKTRQKKNE